jgi:hypothetical protein
MLIFVYCFQDGCVLWVIKDKFYVLRIEIAIAEIIIEIKRLLKMMKILEHELELFFQLDLIYSSLFII